jgi:hypothetical protein
MGGICRQTTSAAVMAITEWSICERVNAGRADTDRHFLMIETKKPPPKPSLDRHKIATILASQRLTNIRRPNDDPRRLDCLAAARAWSCLSLRLPDRVVASVPDTRPSQALSRRQVYPINQETDSSGAAPLGARLLGTTFEKPGPRWVGLFLMTCRPAL